MAEVRLVNVKKIYPFVSGEEKKKKKKVDDEPVKEKANLQITEKGVVAVQEFNLDIKDKEFIVLVGPSGCGKSTTLRMIAGLEEITEGELYIGDKLMNDVAPKDRDIAMVFQNYALYPHMTVYDNMAFSLKLKKTPKAEIDRKVREAAEILDITQYLNRKPKALSGGQRQRVAIGRAIVRNPKVFLMDEPLSNLDAKLRNQMRAELIKLREKIDTTFVYVTHDQMEAMTLATQICLINNGVLQQYEPPLTVYNHPQNLFVADFVGNPSINFVEAKGAQQPDGSITLEILGGVKAVFRPREGLDLAAWFAERDRKAAAHAAERLAKSQEKGYVEKGNKDEPFRYHIAKVEEEDDSLQEDPVLTNEDLVLGIRPEFLNITNEAPLKGEIYGAMPTGMESTIKVYVNGFLLTGVVFGSSLFTIGQQHSVSFTGHHIMLFDRQSGDCIALGSLETL